MKTKFFLLGLAALAFSSCQQFKKGDGGMLYKIHKDESGPTLKEGDFLALKAIYKTESDSVIFSSWDFDNPNFMPMQKSQFKGDIFSALSLLSEGDSATFKFPVDSLVKRQMPVPPGKAKYVVYVFKVEKVIPKGKKTDEVFNAEATAYVTKQREKAKSSEAGKISKYIADNNLKPQTTSSGLQYVLDPKGNGSLAAPGDTVQVNYELHLISGKLFDTSYPDKAKQAVTYNVMRKYEPIKFPVGTVGAAIAGFDEGLRLAPVGSKIKLIMPSKLAYGEQGGQNIPPYTPMVFDIEVLKVIKGVPPAPVATPEPAKK